jgi:hypothetical protein
LTDVYREISFLYLLTAQYEAAQKHLLQALAFAAELNQNFQLLSCLSVTASLLVVKGQFTSAACLFGFVNHRADAAIARNIKTEYPEFERFERQTREQLNEVELQAAHVAGRKMSNAEAVEFALKGIES